MPYITKKRVKIYTAGKTWAAHWYRALKTDFNIVAGWIDIQDVLSGPDDEFPEAIHANKEYLRNIWENGCKVDCQKADMMVLACSPQDGEMHSGSLVELGHVTAYGKPCYILGTCASVEPAGHSDRAWKAQNCVYYWPEFDVTNPQELRAGMEKAVEHYRKNYRDQWLQNNLPHKMDIAA